MSVWDLPRQFWNVARKIEELGNVQGDTRAAILSIEAKLRGIEDRMTRLEADQPRIVTEAKAAAAAAATGLAGSVVSDIVTRVTRIEMRQDDLHNRLAPPG